MSGVFVHDGRRSGHHSWATAAIAAGAAQGVFINPFASPRFSIPRYSRAADFAALATSAGGEVVFDAMTHARLLPGSNRTDLYDSWELWPGPEGDLSTPLRQQQHIERVFERQIELGTKKLTPTVNVTVPSAPDAFLAIELAELGKAIDPQAWQSIAGARTFWGSGSALDDHIGKLVALRSPTWIVTLTNEMVFENVPDISDHDAFEGLLRSVHSLSKRARVIVAFADYAGLLPVAAGADTVGAGWDRGMRFFDPSSFHVDSSPGIRIPASYVTQKSLSAVLRRDAAVAIETWNSTEALRLRGGTMPGSDQAERVHHLRTLSELVVSFSSIGDRSLRASAVSTHFENASRDFDRLILALRPIVREGDKSAWIAHHKKVLEKYIAAEGL